MPGKELKDLFCERFHCRPSDYEARAFKMCLYWHARPFARMIQKIDPNFFTEDYKFIRYLGMAKRSRDINAEMLEFQDSNRAKWRFLRNGLRMRVSGRKAAAVAKMLLSQSQENRGGSET